MERSEWLKRMRLQAEALYDHLAPGYWTAYGTYDNSTHLQFLAQFLARIKTPGLVLDAGCGAGRYDQLLLDAGHTVIGIDQSGAMLARAREHFPPAEYPRLTYQKTGLQELDFEATFDGLICVDALEHVCPEDWPGIAVRLARALKPGGYAYVTLDEGEPDEMALSFALAKAKGLPVVFGEVADQVDESFLRSTATDWEAQSGEESDPAVYHYHPGLDQARAWFDQVGLASVAEGRGLWYAHLMMQKSAD